MVVPCRDGQISVGKVMTIAQKTYKDTFNVDIPVAYLRCGGAILNSGDILADVVEKDAVLVAWTPEDEPLPPPTAVAAVTHVCNWQQLNWW